MLYEKWLFKLKFDKMNMAMKALARSLYKEGYSLSQIQENIKKGSGLNVRLEEIYDIIVDIRNGKKKGE